MTFNIHCSWADYCASVDDTIEATSYDELFQKMEDFFGEACGMTAVGSFDIYAEHRVEDGDDVLSPGTYCWDNENLKRSQDLSDVWNKVKKDIKEKWGEEYFDENQK